MSVLANSRFGGGGGGGQSSELENQIINTVKQDMEAVDKCGQWLFSCYRSDSRAFLPKLFLQPGQGLCQCAWHGGLEPGGVMTGGLPSQGCRLRGPVLRQGMPRQVTRPDVISTHIKVCPGD